MQVQLWRVSYKTLAANSDLCGNQTVTVVGATFDRGESSTDGFTAVGVIGAQPVAGIRITSVANNSPLASAGMRTDDIITAVDETPIPEGKRGIATLSEVISSKTGAPRRVFFWRTGTSSIATVTPTQQCAYPVDLAVSDQVNAYSDGNRIVVTTAMMDLVKSDDELAMIVGHELAHNTMGHLAKTGTNAAIGAATGVALGAVLAGFTGVNVMSPMAQAGEAAGRKVYSQAFEAEADYVGCYYAARGGFDVSNGATLWRRIAVKHPDGIHMGEDYPTTAHRFVAMEETAKEIALKRARGEQIVPNPK
ncbi:MAG: M48 family metalloprotease [Burkholderiales bacterium]